MLAGWVSEAAVVPVEPQDSTTCGDGKGRQCPAATSQAMTSRTWAAVTAVSSSSEPSRMTSNTAVQEVRPGSSAAITE
jgi:hypothetical protein